MLISRSCSWCHRMNFATTRFCENCGHSAHLARLNCACNRCVLARRRAANTARPFLCLRSSLRHLPPSGRVPRHPTARKTTPPQPKGEPP